MRRGMSLADLAERLGVTRATVQGFERSDARDTMRLGTRRRVLAAMGAEEQALTPDQTRSLLLHTVVAARLITDPAREISRAQTNLDRWSQAGRRDMYWLDRWRRVLELPPGQVALLVTERSQDASDMRQGTPFAGALSDDERAAAIQRARELDGAVIS
jgi:transcriptional regulator with XRE-family HTH domain